MMVHKRMFILLNDYTFKLLILNYIATIYNMVKYFVLHITLIVVKSLQPTTTVLVD